MLGRSVVMEVQPFNEYAETSAAGGRAPNLLTSKAAGGDVRATPEGSTEFSRSCFPARPSAHRDHPAPPERHPERFVR